MAYDYKSDFTRIFDGTDPADALDTVLGNIEYKLANMLISFEEGEEMEAFARQLYQERTK